MLWLGPATILPARLLKGTLRISIISSPVFVGILPGGAGEPGPGSGCSVAPFMCMEFVLFGLYKVSFCTAQKWFFRFLFFCFFFNLKVSRGEPLGPVPPLYPPPTLQPPVAAVTSLVPGQRGSSTSLALCLSAPLWLHFVYSFCTAPQLCTSACAAGAGLQRVLPWAVSPAAASWSRAWPSCPAAACCRGPPVCSGPLAGSLEPRALVGLGSAGPPGAPALSSLCISFLSEGARRG